MTVLPANFTLVQVTPRLDAGGVERTTVDISAAVVAAGGRSIVVSEGGRLEDELARTGGELVRMSVASKNPFVILNNASRLARVVTEARADVLHVRSRAPAFSALIAARRTRTPLVATYHGVYNARSPIKRWYNAVMTRGDLVIANSEYTRRHIIAQHGVEPDRVIAIARGTDLERFDPASVSPERIARVLQGWGVAPDDKRTRILLAARLTRWKGQMLLVEAARRLKAAGRTDFVVIMMGDDQGRTAYRAEIETAVQAAGIEAAVILAGHGTDMPAAWLAADLAAVPSLEPEAFGRTAVEPQIMGRPVLAADHGGPAETVVQGQTGWLVAPGDPDAWTEAMAVAIDVGVGRRRAMGQAAAARARSLYSAQTMAEATFGVYARLLENTASPTNPC